MANKIGFSFFSLFLSYLPSFAGLLSSLESISDFNMRRVEISLICFVTHRNTHAALYTRCPFFMRVCYGRCYIIHQNANVPHLLFIDVPLSQYLNSFEWNQLITILNLFLFGKYTMRWTLLFCMLVC